MDSGAHETTPEELTQPEKRKTRGERKKPKHEAQLKEPTSPQPDNSYFLTRPWINLPEVNEAPIKHRARVMTWNLLAQCLVRRELFPTSNCLKAHQRENMIHKEITSSDADILCLQEVDRLDKLTPVIEKAGYTTIYKAGHRKKHGLLIAYRGLKYSKVSDHVISYDEEEVRDGEGERYRRGISFRTKNIGSLVALKSSDSEGNGLIVATTHLFWHPRYTYERTRQVAILLREVVKFRDAINPNWSCIIAGDFNFTPEDPGYSLLVGDPIAPSQEELLALSRVVHESIDPDGVQIAEPKETNNEEEDGAEQDPDRIIVNARTAIPADGLLSTEELVRMVQKLGVADLKSSYDEGLNLAKVSGDSDVRTFGDRVTSIPSTRQGRWEPEWTSYTHFWKTVLDYIFILDPPSHTSHVVGLLKPHATEDMEPGLPQKGVCGSDHVSLVSEIVWTSTSLDKAPKSQAFSQEPTSS
ncbi:Endonuclease/exonuclease/phosphatase [Thelephora terrestris]|uniref:Endonuclease/exonuclease/phosphatase n=1 Tax=Thelephora terrestris TaxID=56493 RepID=A0A9P6HJL9_9AGAM|nr:Endonuclease/exonuclease/phosphatase [Thelephora terrestris]